MNLQKIAQLGRQAASPNQFGKTAAKKAPVPLVRPAAYKSTPKFISNFRPDDTLSSSERLFGGRNWHGSLGLNNSRSATNDLGRVGNAARSGLRNAGNHTESFLRNLFTGGNHRLQWARGQALDAARLKQQNRLKAQGVR
jgi:hypothetical protein